MPQFVPQRPRNVSGFKKCEYRTPFKYVCTGSVRELLQECAVRHAAYLSCFLQVLSGRAWPGSLPVLMAAATASCPRRSTRRMAALWSLLTLLGAALLLLLPLALKQRHRREAAAHAAAILSVEGLSAALAATLSVSQASILRDGWVESAAHRGTLNHGGGAEAATARGGGEGPTAAQEGAGGPSDAHEGGPDARRHLPAWSRETCPRLAAHSGLLGWPRDPSLAAVQAALAEHMRAEAEWASTRGADSEHMAAKGVGFERTGPVVDDDAAAIAQAAARLDLTRRAYAAVFGPRAAVGPHGSNITGVRWELDRLGAPPSLARALLGASAMLAGTGRLLQCGEDEDLLRVRGGTGLLRCGSILGCHL